MAAELSRSVKVHSIPVDLSELGAAEKVFEQVQALGIHVDCLINNAGFGDYGPFATCELAKQERIILVNTLALTALTRLFLPAMLAGGQGHILNVASVASFLPGPLMAVYYATKHFVLSFSESLIEELLETGVRVTVLCPGPVNTAFSRRAEIAPLNFMATTKTTPAEVARYGYRMMKRGKPIAVHSMYYRFLTRFLVPLTPRFALRWLLHRLNAQGSEAAPDMH